MNRPAILALGSAFVASAVTGCDGGRTGPILPDSLRVAQVVVSPSSMAMSEGQSQRFTATVKDSSGGVLDVKVRWESTHLLLAIDSTGLATLTGNPPATVTASVIARAAHESGAANVELVHGPDFSVWPDTNVLFTGMTRALVARLEMVPAAFPGPDIDTVFAATWASGDTTIVTVDATGRITARSPGRTWISAQGSGRTARGWVQVSPPPPEPLRFVSVSSGAVGLGFFRNEAHVEKGCGLTAWGDVYCWGYGMSLDGWSDRCEGLGRDGSTFVMRRYACTEIPVRLTTSTSFYVMANNSSLGCGINGARRVFCWGSNRHGELGVGSIDTLQHGVTPIASTEEFRSVHMTELTSPRQGPAVTACAIRMDDAAFCWGAGYTPTPTRVDGFALSSLAAAGRCGVTTDGTMRCLPHEGSIPVISGSGLVEVATQWFSHNCARQADGSVHCVRYREPTTRMELGEPAAMISAYWSGVGDRPSVCAITVSGQLRCGLTTTAEVFPGRRWKSFFGNCGIATDDKTYCWHGAAVREVPGQ